MPLPLMKIGPLIQQLIKLIKAAEPIIGYITTKIKDGSNLKEAVELQAGALKSLEEQLKVVQSVLTNIQKSLQIWALATTGLGIVSVLALIVAMAKR